MEENVSKQADIFAENGSAIAEQEDVVVKKEVEIARLRKCNRGK